MSLPLPEKKKKIPSFDEVMNSSTTEKERIPSYDEVMGDSKKKRGYVDLEKSSLVAGDGLSPSQSQLGGGNNQQSQPVSKEIDPFDAVKNSTDLRNKTVTNFSSAENGGDYLQPDTQAAAEADKVDAQLKDRGFGKDFIDAVKDLPQEALSDPNTSSAVLQNDYLNNKVAFNQKVNEAKNHWAIRKSVEENTDGTPEEKRQAGIIAANAYTGDIHPKNFQEFEQTIKNKQDIINHSLPTQEDKDKANDRLKSTYSTYITPSDPDLQEEYNSSPLKTQLDPVQYAGLKTMELFEPEKYKQTISFLSTPIQELYNHSLPNEAIKNFQSPVAVSTNYESTDPKGGKLSQKTIDEKIGMETRLRELADIGRENIYTSAEKQNSELKPQINALPDGDETKNKLIEQYNNNISTVNSVSEDANNDDSKYPLTKQLKFERQTADILGKAPSLVNNAAIKFAQQAGNPEKAIFNLFGDSPSLQRQRMGESQSMENFTYLPEQFKRENSPIIPVYPKDVQEKIKDINSNKDLSFTEKQNQTNQVLQDNQSRIKTITNPDLGKPKNFFSKATAYTMSSFFGSVGGMAFAMAGNPIKGKMGEMLSLGALSHNDYYTEAVDKGISDPNQYANLHAGVTMLAATLGTQFDNVKKAIRLNAASKDLLNGISESTWNDIVSKNAGKINKLKSSIATSLKDNGKTVALWGGGVPAAQSVANNLFYGEHKTAKEIGEEAFKGIKDMAIGQLPLALLQIGTGYKNASNLQKSTLWEIGDNKDIQLQRIKEQADNGTITKDEADKRSATVKEVSSLIDKVPLNDKKGKPLTDEAKTDYLYNSYMKSKANELSKNLPVKESVDADHIAAVADAKQSLIINPQTDIQLQSRADKLQSDIDKKDENGKPVLNDKEILSAKAELEAVNDAINDSKKNKVPNTEKEGSIADEGTDKVSGETEESSLAKQIRERKVEGVSAGTDNEVIDYAIDKAAEAPSKFKEQHPEIFDQIKDKIPTEKLQENLDFLIKNNPDSKDVDVLDKMISDRENATPNKENVGSGVGGDVVGDLSPLQKELQKANAPQKLIDAVPKDTKLREGFLTDTKRLVDSLLGLAGNFSTKENKVRIGKFYSSLFGGRDKVLIHEAAHAATMSVYGDILRNEGDYTKEQVAAARELNDIAWKYLENTSSWAKMTFPRLYGTTNPYEFIAEFIANPKFRDYVAENSPSKKTNVVNYIWDGILKMLGIKKSEINQELIDKIQAGIDATLEVSAAKNKAVEQSIKETTKANTSNVGVEEGSGGVGGDEIGRAHV